MRCKETQKLTSAYIDCELDALKNVAAENHFSACAACGSNHEDHLNLRRTIRSGVRYFTAPGHLKILIRKKISEI